jgi:hypothetical protein
MGVKIWRVYSNGEIKNETHVLQPHFAGGQRCKGYDGDVSAWSESNKRERFGCAQIMQEGDKLPVVLHKGYLSDAQLAGVIKTGIKFFP